MLKDLQSIVNGNADAGDSQRVYTFVEFTKLLPESDFLLYEDYLKVWNKTRVEGVAEDEKAFVHGRLLELLKTITLSYSSYEEQRALANLDWENPSAVHDAIPFFARKVLEISRFYRGKRRELRNAARKNSSRGTAKGIEEIVYDNLV